MNWHDWIPGNELPIRLSFFFGIFAVMAIGEIVSPCRVVTVSKGVHWVNKLGLVFLKSFILRTTRMESKALWKNRSHWSAPLIDADKKRVSVCFRFSFAFNPCDPRLKVFS